MAAPRRQLPTDGVLHIRAVRALLKRDVQTVGKQDPYLRIKVKDQTFKSPVAKDMGKKPVWTDGATQGGSEEWFDVQLEPDEDVKLEVWNENIVSDTFIAGAQPIHVNQLLGLAGQNGMAEIGLVAKEQDGGVLTIQVQYTPPLRVNVVKGINLRDVATLTKMDPYVKVSVVGRETIGSNLQRTDVAKSAGPNPTFEQLFTFFLRHETHTAGSAAPGILFQAYDDDLVSDDFIGECEVQMADAFGFQRQEHERRMQGGHAQPIHLPLTHGKKKKDAGKIEVTFA